MAGNTNNSLRVSSGEEKSVFASRVVMSCPGRGDGKRNSHVSLVSAGKEDSAMQNNSIEIERNSIQCRMLFR